MKIRLQKLDKRKGESYNEMRKNGKDVADVCGVFFF